MTASAPRIAIYFINAARAGAAPPQICFTAGAPAASVQPFQFFLLPTAPSANANHPGMKLSVLVPTIDQGAIDAILGAYHGDPFSVLGMHQVGEHLVVRVFRPDARAVVVQDVSGAGGV